MHVNNSNFLSKKEEIPPKERIINTLSLWTAIGLLWYAFYQMLEEQFSFFFQVKIEGEAGTLAEVPWFLLILWLGLLWLAYDYPEQLLQKAGLWVQGAALAVPLVYALFYYEKIISGLLALLERYMPYVNAYYRTAYWIQGGELEDIPMASTFLMMLLWLFCWMLAYGCKKKLFLAVFPAAALALELAVGLSPKEEGLLAWFAGCSVLLSLGGALLLPKCCLLVSVAAAFCCASMFCQEQIADWSSEEQKQVLLDWQEEVKQQNWWKLFLPDFFQEQEVLKNEAPAYQGELCLTITADKSPKTSVYLKGFYGSRYQDGTWIWDDAAFANACKAAGSSEETAAKQLFQLPYEQIEAYWQTQAEEAEKIVYEITYTEQMKELAYVPYASNYESLDSAYHFLGDSLLRKSFWDKRVKVEAIAPEFLEYAKLSAVADSKKREEKQQEAMGWYTDFVAEYLDVPKELTELRRIAEELKKQKKDASRLEYASLVAEYLQTQMSYSLELDTLLEGTDPVEYALTESKEGYCMHFASAGTLLLRLLSVPARYVSGYIVKPDTFDASEGEFRAEITDYAAHAWVEIYLDNIGWVPVEMTPGYGSETRLLPTQKEPETTKTEEERPLPESEELSQESEKQSPEIEIQLPQESMSEEGAETETLPPAEAETEGAERDDEAPGFDVSERERAVSFLWKLLLVFTLFAGLLCWKKRYDARLNAEIQKGDSRRVVWRIQRRMAVQLRILRPKRRFWQSSISDKTYEQLLITVFRKVSEEDWKKYMEIIKKMHYSSEIISREEMLHCCYCYETAVCFNKMLIKR